MYLLHVGLKTKCEAGFFERLVLAVQVYFIEWRPQGDLNPCRRRERPVSWARLDDGDASHKICCWLGHKDSNLD